MRGWIALDETTGAMMTRTHGRGKNGLPKYVLILPKETLAQRNNDLFSSYTWENPDRKFIRAWNDTEAIKEGNIKLEKMLNSREVARNE